MNFTKKIKNSLFAHKFQQYSQHPYFGFIVAGIILLFAGFLFQVGLVKISTIRALGLTVIYFIIALGFTLLLGYSGLASLGTAGFVGLGTYIIGFFVKTAGMPLFASFIIAVLLAIILGGVVGFISLRIEGLYLAIITLGLSEILNEIFKNADVITGGVTGLSISTIKIFGFLKVNLGIAYNILVISMVVAMILTMNLINSPIGRAMLSMKNSTSAAQAMGISLLRYRLLAFVLATVYAVIGGGLYMVFYKFSIPFSWNLALSLNILAAVVVGGAKSIWGVFLGAFLIFGFDLAVLQKLKFFQANPNASLIFSGSLIILTVMFYPNGLIQLFNELGVKIKHHQKQIKINIRRSKYGNDSEQNSNKEEFISNQYKKIRS